MTQGKLELLTPQNCALILIDHQPQMTFGVANIDRQLLKNNVIALAKTAQVFKVPTVLTSVETESFSGNIWPELLAVLPDNKIFERTSMNTWDDVAVKAELKKIGRKKLVFAALWTEVCLNFPVLEAMADGYEVYFVEDASGGTSVAAHNMSVQRMIQAGAVPVTWQQFLLEMQRDWARKETYAGTTGIVVEHSGAYGAGIDYAITHVHKMPARKLG
ncbi:hydrolase [Polaromonas sp. JS666]|uniref:hydrolase n=1 Tax=Polaromonas sp. (strain JS666 / ATCC BAA-500) TaxID=296591 RepID=UPI0000463D39|nr:hydrolase [Polaromonas sp. JS666]ABE46690.1 isochorismatase hydrolase [Polaromonas sp. JS666]